MDAILRKPSIVLTLFQIVARRSSETDRLLRCLPDLRAPTALRKYQAGTVCMAASHIIVDSVPSFTT